MNRVATSVGAQLARPTGWPGRILGIIMRIANRRATALTIGALGIQPGDTVLDLGCGFGDALPALVRAARGGAVHGVDHSDAVEVAGRSCPEARVHRADFAALPFADGAIDRVLAANVAYFWADVRTILGEVHRVLRPNGRLAIYVTDARRLRALGPSGGGTHLLFTGETLQAVLGPAARVVPVDAGFGVRGWVATLDRTTGSSGVDWGTT